MTNEKLTESLQLLRDMVVKTNKVMQQAEKTVETAMLMMMKNQILLLILIIEENGNLKMM